MDTTPPPSASQPSKSEWTLGSESSVRAIQRRLAKGLSLSAEQQASTVRNMLVHSPSMAVTYWLQLCLSIGIATLGLVLNSAGVVIGAMLIAPLMGPIVELAMALTVGSPLLMLRSLLRIASSVVIAVLASAAIHRLIPFHEVTTEIAARTTPTAIDLFVAVLCAFAAAFSTVRSSSETVSTAAGTSISIALVPPLCVVGFGLAHLQWSVALGAALLFTANLSAILMFAALFFFVLGFDAIKPQTLEHEVSKEESPRLGRISAGLWRLFGHRYGFVLRILIPLSLVGAVSVPLAHALATVAWEVRVRAAIQHILAQEIPSERSVQSNLVVQNRQVSLRLVLVAKPERARALEERLRLRLAQASGVEPSLSVLAVPGEQAIREVTLLLGRLKAAETLVQPSEPDLLALRHRLSASIGEQWPVEAAGRLLGWQLSFDRNRTLVECTHLGAPLGAAAEELLARKLSMLLGSNVTLRDRPIDPGERTPDLSAPEKLWPLLLRSADAVRENASLSLCVGLPEVALSKPPSPSELAQKASLDAIRAVVDQLGPQGSIMTQASFRLRVSDGPCGNPTNLDGGVSQSVDAGSRTTP